MDFNVAIRAIEELIERGEELDPNPDSPEFTQWRTTLLSRLPRVLPTDSTVTTQISTLRFKPSEMEYINSMMSPGFDGVDAVDRFNADMKQAIALMNAGIEEVHFVARHGGEIGRGDEPVAGKVNIYDQNIKQMMSEIQAKFDKHPIRIPIEANDRALQGATVNNFNGPVVNVSGNGAQVAWNSDSINQNQDNSQQVAPGFEAIAAAIGETLKGLPSLGLSPQDQEDAEAAARDALTELTQPVPNKGKLRRAVAMLKGFLAPVLLSAQTGAGKDVEEWVHTAIEQLGSSLT